MGTTRFVNLLRLCILIFSLLACGMHITQCMLLATYQQKAKMPSWLDARHWQYLVWFIVLGLSLISSATVCMNAFCCGRVHIFRGDRILGIVNGIPLLAVILATTFIENQEPWTDNTIEFTHPDQGFITYCYTLDMKNDIFYPILYQRCLLLNGIYVVGALLSALWFILVISSSIAHTKRRQKLIAEVKRLQNIHMTNTSFSTHTTKPSTAYYEPRHSTGTHVQYSSHLDSNYNPQNTILQPHQTETGIANYYAYPPLASYGEKVELSSHHHYDDYYIPSNVPAYSNYSSKQNCYQNGADNMWYSYECPSDTKGIARSMTSDHSARQDGHHQPSNAYSHCNSQASQHTSMREAKRYYLP
ncbi:hypothetical protein BDF14DRAFT_1842064 [Spinellus fusiger]|nr:hypothetical protein BDF14DRAFT_1842064 [Spinellus fusiger]